MTLEGKVALVTGASGGIGRGIAQSLAEAGADVVVNYQRDADGAEETARIVRDNGRRALVVQADVGDPEAVVRMFEASDAEFGRFDILVNNAGHGGGGRIATADFAAWNASSAPICTGRSCAASRPHGA